VAYPVARALQTKYEFSLNDAGLERAIEKARQLRAAADSAPPAVPGMTTPLPTDSGAAAGTTPPPSN
jgi:peptidyl-prolyl cis-trans isomerase D